MRTNYKQKYPPTMNSSTVVKSIAIFILEPMKTSPYVSLMSIGDKTYSVFSSTEY